MLLPLLAACHDRDGHHPGDHDGDATGSDGVGAPGQQFVVSYDIPENHRPRDFALIAQRSISLGEGAQTLSEGDGFAALANVGAQQLQLGEDAESGSIISLGDVSLGGRARVHGDVSSAGTVQKVGQPAGSVDGTTTEHATIGTRHIERTVVFPGTMAAAKELSGAAADETLAPGYYESLSIEGDARVTLPSGEYYFDQLHIGPRATLVLDDGGGPISIYVREKLETEGAWEHEGDEVARLTLVYLGANDVQLHREFQGTLIAPSAKLELLETQAPSDLATTDRLRSASDRSPDGSYQRAWPHAEVESHHTSGPGWGNDRHGWHHGFGHRHHFHHQRGHGHDHDPEPPTDDEDISYVGTFVGLEVALGAHVELLHQPIADEKGPDAGGRYVSFEFPLPGGVSPEEVDIAGIAGVQIAGGVTLGAGCNPSSALVTSSAQGQLTVGSGSQLGSIVSAGAVRLSSGSTLSGSVSSAAGIVAGGAEIAGLQHANASLGTPRTLSWSVTFPGSPLPDLQLESGRARVLYPEVYGKVSLASGATLYLTSGTYHFGSLIAAAGSSIVLESSGGPVMVNVLDELRLEGNVSGLGGVKPELFVAYAGTRTTFVGGSFDGSLIAPRAGVSVLGGEHTGQIFGRTVDVAAGVTLHQCSAAWPFLLGEPMVHPQRVTLPPSPVFLTATGEDDAHQSVSAPVHFEIPDMLPVSRGNAGNGTAILTFTTAGGASVSCTYRGGASVEHPETLLELAKGREYLFDSCSNGAEAGSTVTGSDFSLSVQGDPEGAGGTAAIDLALGDGCDGALRAPISPAHSIEMLQAFDWSATHALPETNADGTPTLYYANIYIRNDMERELLNRFLIDYQGKPFFDDELEALYGGKCGALDLSGDGKGLFVFAIIPGKTYNRIRAAVTNDDIRPEERVMFQAIVLRDAPEAIRNANGSLNYDYLKQAGYYYLGVRDLPVDAALDYTALPGGAAKGFVDAIEFVATAARDVGRAAVTALGDVDRFAQGAVTLRLDIDVSSRLPTYPQPILRGWGRDAAKEAGLRGVRVEFHQWAQSLYALGVPMPTSYHGTANRDGAVSIRVAKGGGPSGDISVMGMGGICVDTENNAAKMTGFLLTNSVCNFRSLNVTSIAAGGASAAASSLFGNFQNDTDAVLSSTHRDTMALVEASNTYDYVRNVVGTKLRQARILTGAYARDISFGKDVAWTPCWGFPNGLSDADFLLTAGIPVIGEITNVLLTTDIVDPPAAHLENEYGVMSHEYGHYTMCGLIDTYSEYPALTFSTLLTDVALEGGTVQAHDPTRVISEAFADFIAGQVMGGANYINLNEAVRVGLLMRVCNGGPNAQCWDENLFSEGSGNQAIGRVGTLLHDAFDGHPRLTDAPTNGDIWTGSGTALTLDTTGYGDAHDEEVALGGPRLAEFVDNFLLQNVVLSAFENGLPSFSFRMDAFERALGQVVETENNWCQACDMFLPHMQNAAGLQLLDRWAACASSERIVHAIGTPPDPDLRLGKASCELCPAGEVPDSITGQCVACPFGSFIIGNTCQSCGPGSAPQGTSCVACGPYAVSDGVSCIPCPLGQAADPATDTCVDCAVDAVLDWSTVADKACSIIQLNQVSAPGDVCPDQFWIDAVNLDGNSPDGRSSDFSIRVRLEDDIEDEAQCVASTAQGVLAEVAGSSLTTLSSVPPTTPGICFEDPNVFCEEGHCVPLVDMSLTSAEVSAGRTSVRIMGNAVGPSGNLSVNVTVETKTCNGGPVH